MAFILSFSPPKKITGQMMWPSWDRLSTVSLGWPCKKKKKYKQGSGWYHLKKRENEGRERTVVFDIKETFCLPFEAPVKSATNMEIHYETLLIKCDQSLCSQLGTGDRLWCLSVRVWRVLISQDLTMRRRDLVSFLLFLFSSLVFSMGKDTSIDKWHGWEPCLSVFLLSLSVFPFTEALMCTAMCSSIVLSFTAWIMCLWSRDCQNKSCVLKLSADKKTQYVI